MQIVRQIDPSTIWGHLELQGKATRQPSTSVKELLENHFFQISELNHVCRPTLSLALESLGGHAACIIETGSAAHGTKSSLLFDSYVNSFGGDFYSVDSRLEPLIDMEALCTSRSHFYCNDSVNFLRTIANSGLKVDLLYLDSFDVNLNDPIPSAVHGLQELLAALPLLKDGSVLLVDDTPLSMNVWERVHGEGTRRQYQEFYNRYRINPGKGGLIKQFLIAAQIGTMIEHDYQLLWRF